MINKNQQQTEDRIEQPKTKSEFKSSFKSWIRVVAFIVVAIFLPEQVAQAVEYDWRVLYHKPAIGSIAPSYLKDLGNIDTALAIRNILKDIANKPVTSIRVSSNLTINLDKPLEMSNQRIDEITEWLKGKPCGSKALFDYLNYTGTPASEADIAIMALTIDILNDVTRPEGNPEVIKTSLYALSKTAEFFGQKLYPVKLDLAKFENNPGLTPFIAHVNGDHYVLVTRITEDKIYYSDNHKEEFLPKDNFLIKFTGYALLSILPVGLNVLDIVESKQVLGAFEASNSFKKVAGGSSYSAAQINNIITTTQNTVRGYENTAVSNLNRQYLNDFALSYGISAVVALGTAGFGAYVAPHMSSVGNWFSMTSQYGMSSATRYAITGAAAGYLYNGIANNDWASIDSLKYSGIGAAVGWGIGYAGSKIFTNANTTGTWLNTAKLGINDPTLSGNWGSSLWNSLSPSSTASFYTWPVVGAAGGYVYGGITTGDWGGDALKYAGYGAAIGFGARSLYGISSWLNGPANLNNDLINKPVADLAKQQSLANIGRGFWNAQVVYHASHLFTQLGMDQDDAELGAAALGGFALGATGGLNSFTTNQLQWGAGSTFSQNLLYAFEGGLIGAGSNFVSKYVMQTAIDKWGVQDQTAAMFIGNVAGLATRDLMAGGFLSLNNFYGSEGGKYSLGSISEGVNRNIGEVATLGKSGFETPYTFWSFMKGSFNSQWRDVVSGGISNGITEYITRHPEALGLDPADTQNISYTTYMLSGAGGGLVGPTGSSIFNNVLGGVQNGALKIGAAYFENKLLESNPSMSHLLAAYIVDIGSAAVLGAVVGLRSDKGMLYSILNTTGNVGLNDGINSLSSGYIDRNKSAFGEMSYISTLTNSYGPVTNEMSMQELQRNSVTGTTVGDGSTVIITVDGQQLTVTLDSAGRETLNWDDEDTTNDTTVVRFRQTDPRADLTYSDAAGNTWVSNGDGSFSKKSTQEYNNSFMMGWAQVSHDIYQQGAVRNAGLIVTPVVNVTQRFLSNALLGSPLFSTHFADRNKTNWNLPVNLKNTVMNLFSLLNPAGLSSEVARTVSPTGEITDLPGESVRVTDDNFFNRFFGINDISIYKNSWGLPVGRGENNETTILGYKGTDSITEYSREISGITGTTLWGVNFSQMKYQAGESSNIHPTAYFHVNSSYSQKYGFVINKLAAVPVVDANGVKSIRFIDNYMNAEGKAIGGMPTIEASIVQPEAMSYEYYNGPGNMGLGDRAKLTAIVDPQKLSAYTMQPLSGTVISSDGLNDKEFGTALAGMVVFKDLSGNISKEGLAYYSKNLGINNTIYNNGETINISLAGQVKNASQNTLKTGNQDPNAAIKTHFSVSDVEGNAVGVFNMMDNTDFIRIGNSGAELRIGDTVYGNAGDTIRKIGADSNAQDLTYGTYQGVGDKTASYKYQITSEGNLFFSPQGGQGTINGFNADAANAVTLAGYQFWASSQNTNLTAANGVFANNFNGGTVWASREVRGKYTEDIKGAIETLSLPNQKVTFEANSKTGGGFLSLENPEGNFTLNGKIDQLNSEAAITTTDMRWQILYNGTAVSSRDRASIPSMPPVDNKDSVVTIQREVLKGTIMEAEIDTAKSIGMDVDSSIVETKGSNKFYLTFDADGNLANADFHTGQYEQGAHWLAGALPTAGLVENKIGNGFERYVNVSNAIVLEGKEYFASPAYSGIDGLVKADTGEIYFGASGLPALGDYSHMEHLNGLSAVQPDPSGAATSVRFNLDEVVRTDTSNFEIGDRSITGTITNTVDWDLSRAKGTYEQTLFGKRLASGDIYDVGVTKVNGQIAPTLAISGSLLIPESVRDMRNEKNPPKDSTGVNATTVNSQLNLLGRLGGSSVANLNNENFNWRINYALGATGFIFGFENNKVTSLDINTLALSGKTDWSNVAQATQLGTTIIADAVSDAQGRPALATSTTITNAGNIIRADVGVKPGTGSTLNIGKNDYQVNSYYLNTPQSKIVEVPKNATVEQARSALINQGVQEGDVNRLLGDWERTKNTKIEYTVSSWATYQQREGSDLVFPKVDVNFGPNIQADHQVAWTIGNAVVNNHVVQATESGLNLFAGDRTAATAGSSGLKSQVLYSYIKDGKQEVAPAFGWDALPFILQSLTSSTVTTVNAKGEPIKSVDASTKDNSAISFVNNQTYTITDRIGGVLYNSGVTFMNLSYDANANLNDFGIISQAGHLNYANVKASETFEITNDQATYEGRSLMVQAETIKTNSGDHTIYNLVDTANPDNVVFRGITYDLATRSGSARVARLKWDDRSLAIPFGVGVVQNENGDILSENLNYLGGADSTGFGFNDKGQVTGVNGSTVGQISAALSSNPQFTTVDTRGGESLATSAPLSYQYQELVNGNWKTPEGRTYLGADLNFAVFERVNNDPVAARTVVYQDTRVEQLDVTYAKDGTKTTQLTKNQPQLYYGVENLSFVPQALAKGTASTTSTRYNLLNHENAIRIADQTKNGEGDIISTGGIVPVLLQVGGGVQSLAEAGGMIWTGAKLAEGDALADKGANVNKEWGEDGFAPHFAQIDNEKIGTRTDIFVGGENTDAIFFRNDGTTDALGLLETTKISGEDIVSTAHTTRHKSFLFKSGVIGSVETRTKLLPMVARQGESGNWDQVPHGRYNFSEDLGYNVQQNVNNSGWVDKQISAQDDRMSFLDKEGNVVQDNVLHYLIRDLSFASPVEEVANKGASSQRKDSGEQESPATAGVASIKLGYELNYMDRMFGYDKGILTGTKGAVLPVLMGLDETGNLNFNPTSLAQGLSYKYMPNSASSFVTYRIEDGNVTKAQADATDLAQRSAEIRDGLESSQSPEQQSRQQRIEARIAELENSRQAVESGIGELENTESNLEIQREAIKEEKSNLSDLRWGVDSLGRWLGRETLQKEMGKDNWQNEVNATRARIKQLESQADILEDALDSKMYRQQLNSLLSQRSQFTEQLKQLYQERAEVLSPAQAAQERFEPYGNDGKTYLVSPETARLGIAKQLAAEGVLRGNTPDEASRLVQLDLTARYQEIQDFQNFLNTEPLVDRNGNYSDQDIVDDMLIRGMFNSKYDNLQDTREILDQKTTLRSNLADEVEHYEDNVLPQLDSATRDVAAQFMEMESNFLGGTRIQNALDVTQYIAVSSQIKTIDFINNHPLVFVVGLASAAACVATVATATVATSATVATVNTVTTTVATNAVRQNMMRTFASKILTPTVKVLASYYLGSTVYVAINPITVTSRSSGFTAAFNNVASVGGRQLAYAFHIADYRDVDQLETSIVLGSLNDMGAIGIIPAAAFGYGKFYLSAPGLALNTISHLRSTWDGFKSLVTGISDTMQGKATNITPASFAEWGYLVGGLLGAGRSFNTMGKSLQGIAQTARFTQAGQLSLVFNGTENLTRTGRVLYGLGSTIRSTELMIGINAGIGLGIPTLRGLSNGDFGALNKTATQLAYNLDTVISSAFGMNLIFSGAGSLLRGVTGYYGKTSLAKFVSGDIAPASWVAKMGIRSPQGVGALMTFSGASLYYSGTREGLNGTTLGNTMANIGSVFMGIGLGYIASANVATLNKGYASGSIKNLTSKQMMARLGIGAAGLELSVVGDLTNNNFLKISGLAVTAIAAGSLIRGYQGTRIWFSAASLGIPAAGLAWYGVRQGLVNPALGVYVKDKNGEIVKAGFGNLYNLVSAPNIFGENPLTYYGYNSQTGKHDLEFQTPVYGDLPYVLMSGAMFLALGNTTRLYSKYYERGSFSQNPFRAAWTKIREPFNTRYTQALSMNSATFAKRLTTELKFVAAGLGVVGLNNLPENIRKYVPILGQLNTDQWKAEINVLGGAIALAGFGAYALAKSPNLYKIVSGAGVDTGLRSVGTLFTVIAPLQIAVEGASALVYYFGLPSATTGVERYILGNFAAFWQPARYGYDKNKDGKIDATEKSLLIPGTGSELKYAGVWNPANKGYLRSFQDMFVTGYMAGLMGTNLETGMLKVSSLSQLGGFSELTGAIWNADPNHTNVAFALILGFGMQPIQAFISNIPMGDFGRKFAAFGKSLKETVGFGMVGLESSKSSSALVNYTKRSLSNSIELVFNGTRQEFIDEQIVDIISSPVMGILQGISGAISPTWTSKYFPLIQEIWQEVATPEGGAMRSLPTQLYHDSKVNKASYMGIAHADGTTSIINNIANTADARMLANVKTGDQIVIVRQDGLRRIFDVDDTSSWSNFFNVQAQAIDYGAQLTAGTVTPAALVETMRGQDKVASEAAAVALVNSNQITPAQAIQAMQRTSHDFVFTLGQDANGAPVTVMASEIMPQIHQRIAYDSAFENQVRAVAPKQNALSQAMFNAHMAQAQAIRTGDGADQAQVETLINKLNNLRTSAALQRELSRYNLELKSPVHFIHNNKVMAELKSKIISNNYGDINKQIGEVKDRLAKLDSQATLTQKDRIRKLYQARLNRLENISKGKIDLQQELGRMEFERQNRNTQFVQAMLERNRVNQQTGEMVGKNITFNQAIENLEGVEYKGDATVFKFKDGQQIGALPLTIELANGAKLKVPANIESLTEVQTLPDNQNNDWKVDVDEKTGKASFGIWNAQEFQAIPAGRAVSKDVILSEPLNAEYKDGKAVRIINKPAALNLQDGKSLVLEFEVNEQGDLL